jgi:hypothetical protein
MFKKFSESLDKTRDKQSREKGAGPEQVEGPVFATSEELAEKEELLKALKQIESDKSIEGLTKQKEIYAKLFQLDERRKQRIAREKGEASLGELPEKLKLPEQYASQKDILERTGILEKLSSGEPGIRGIDNKEYVMPKYEDILQRIEAKGEILKTKIEQGFTKLLIVPFGMKLDDLIEKYSQVILEHHKAGTLLATKEKPTDPDEALELDENQPAWKWDGYNNADIEGKLVYFPKEFSQNHQGKTKEELIKEQGGWNILLIEDLPNIPRAGKGKIIQNRKQLEANKTPNEYLQTLQTDKQYQNESGMTPEDQVSYAITHLEQTNQVIDDYSGKGSASYQLGAYFAASGGVPHACWNRGFRQAFLGRPDPGNRYSGLGARGAVRVG